MQRAEAEYAIGLLCQLQGVRAFSSLTPEGGMVLFSTLTSLTLPPPAPHTTSQESTMAVLIYSKSPEELWNILGKIFCPNPTSHYSSSPP